MRHPRTRLFNKPLNPADVKVKELQSEKLSHFRTRHDFLHYGEFSSPSEFVEYHNWARANGVPMIIIGNGSNVLFKKRRIRSLVLKNNLPKVLTDAGDNRLQVSSSAMVAQVLKWCQERNLDSCYYLASVPATVGGAVAMNAGRGRPHNRSIFDFVESVTVLQNGEVRTLMKEEIPVSYRQTPFTGIKFDLILYVVLKFTPLSDPTDHRRERVQWSKKHQDHSSPNCGSVFKKFENGVMVRLQGVKFFSARFSPKTRNWILSSGKSSWPIVCLILIAKALHLVKGKRAEVELIEVD